MNLKRFCEVARCHQLWVGSVYSGGGPWKGVGGGYCSSKEDRVRPSEGDSFLNVSNRVRIPSCCPSGSGPVLSYLWETFGPFKRNFEGKIIVLCFMFSTELPIDLDSSLYASTHLHERCPPIFFLEVGRTVPCVACYLLSSCCACWLLLA